MANPAKTLNFSAHDLGQQVDLMLTFGSLPADPSSFNDLQKMCWKLLEINGQGVATASVEYTGHTAFFTPQRKEGNIIHSSSSQLCENGSACELVSTPSGTIIKLAGNGQPNVMECKNATDSKEDIGIGLCDKAGENVEPVLIFTDIGPASSIVVEFTPKLKIYAVSVQTSTIIQDIVIGPVLWEQDLSTLKRETNLKISIDKNTGVLAIKQLKD